MQIKQHPKKILQAETTNLSRNAWRKYDKYNTKEHVNSKTQNCHSIWSTCVKQQNQQQTYGRPYMTSTLFLLTRDREILSRDRDLLNSRSRLKNSRSRVFKSWKQNRAIYWRVMTRGIVTKLLNILGLFNSFVLIVVFSKTSK